MSPMTTCPYISPRPKSIILSPYRGQHPNGFIPFRDVRFHEFVKSVRSEKQNALSKFSKPDLIDRNKIKWVFPAIAVRICFVYPHMVNTLVTMLIVMSGVFS